MIIDKSQIVICKDIEVFLKDSIEFLDIHQVRIFRAEKENFSMSEAKAVIKESYTSTEQKKYIFICGKRFGIEAQNALLKVLEEPPNNIIFIIVTNSKSVLLPTIHSRLPLIEDSKIEELEKIDFNYHKFDLAFLQNYIKNNRYLSKEDAANYIQSLFLNLSNMEIKLNEYQLEKFSKALKMLDLHVRPINIVSSILLMLLNSKKA